MVAWTVKGEDILGRLQESGRESRNAVLDRAGIAPLSLLAADEE
jgi:hypothetical protein